MAAVGERRVGGGVAQAHEVRWHEEAQIVDVRLVSLAHQPQAVRDGRPQRVNVLDAQPQVVRAHQYLGAMRLHAAANDHRDWVAAILESRDRLDGHQPALIWVEATDLEEEEAVGVATAHDLAQLRGARLVNRCQVAAGDAVGDGERVDVVLPEPVLHVAADGGDRRAIVEPAPIDAMQRHQAVAVPHQDAALAHAVPVEQVGDAADRLGGVPVLTDDDHQLARSDGRGHDVVVDVARHGLVVVVELALLAVVDAVEVVAADPLAPAFQAQLAADALLHAGCGRVADEDQVRLVAQAGQRLGELGDARAQAAGGGVDVRPLEAERDEDRVLRRDAAPMLWGGRGGGGKRGRFCRRGGYTGYLDQIRRDHWGVYRRRWHRGQRSAAGVPSAAGDARRGGRRCGGRGAGREVRQGGAQCGGRSRCLARGAAWAGDARATRGRRGGGTVLTGAGAIRRWCGRGQSLLIAVRHTSTLWNVLTARPCGRPAARGGE